MIKTIIFYRFYVALTEIDGRTKPKKEKKSYFIVIVFIVYCNVALTKENMTVYS